MRKKETIHLNDIEDYLKYQRLRTELVLNLTRVKELAEEKLEILKRTQTIAEQMKMIQQIRKIKEEDLDLKKEIMKHANW